MHYIRTLLLLLFLYFFIINKKTIKIYIKYIYLAKIK